MSARSDRYKWVALSNTTIGMLMATINSSIVLIALPDIFRGIHLDPLEPGNSGYLLWMLMGFLVATAVLVVSFGRIGDMYGRVRMFNFGFAIFTAVLDPALADMDGRRGGGPLADRDADRPGRGRRAAHGQLLGDPDRRVPARRARAGARDQRGVGHRRLVHRARARRRPRPRCRGGSCSSSRSRSGSSARSGRGAARGARRAAPREDRLVGQPDLRAPASSRCWSASRTASSRTAATRWAGRIPRCSWSSSAAWPCSACSC